MPFANWSQRRWLLAMAGLCIAAVALALVGQYGFDMRPCPWCILQRLIFVVIALLCLLGAAGSSGAVQRPAAGLVLVFALLGGAAALYQHFVAAKSVSCNLTLADKIITALQLESLMPSLFQITGSCAEGAVSVLGVPFEFWSLALFVVVGALAVRVLAARRR
jgi:disulfide bond formation protein DsbB